VLYRQAYSFPFSNVTMLEMKLVATVCQYECPLDVAEANNKLSQMAKIAKQPWVLTTCCTGNRAWDACRCKEMFTRDYLPDLIAISKENELHLATSFYKKEKGKFFNQGYLISPTGEIIVSHKKIYLAPPERDNDGISSGKVISVSESPIGNVGMLICKDGFNKYSHLLYERFNQLQTTIICIPVWSLGTFEPDTQEYIKAHFVYGSFTSRAFVLASGNLNSSTKSFGRALIVSPIQGVLAEGSTDREELLTRELDLTEPEKARKFDSFWQPPHISR